MVRPLAVQLSVAPPFPPKYNVGAHICPSRGHVHTAKILQVLYGASLHFNFVFGGEGVLEDGLGNMISDNTGCDNEVFYLQYCFRQPSEFHISSLHIWSSLRISVTFFAMTCHPDLSLIHI